MSFRLFPAFFLHTPVFGGTGLSPLGLVTSSRVDPNSE